MAKVTPVSSKLDRAGFVQLGIASYAEGLCETWWDRELGIGDRAVVRDPDTGKTSAELVKLGWPVAKVATLASHFGIGFCGNSNAETRTVPIIGLKGSYSAKDREPLGCEGSFVHTQPSMLVKNWELELFDYQPAEVFGLSRELISAGRLDYKFCSWAALMGLLHADESKGDGYIKLVGLFDDEEVRSKLRQGTDRNFLPIAIERVVEALSLLSAPPAPWAKHTPNRSSCLLMSVTRSTQTLKRSYLATLQD